MKKVGSQSYILENPVNILSTASIVGPKEKSGPLYNNASQVYNHYFYFDQFNINGSHKPFNNISNLINDQFGSFENFQKDFIFSGAITGKKTHTYFFVDDIYTDENGNITGDSIDLSQCDYRLDDIDIFDFEKIFEEEIEVQTYE